MNPNLICPQCISYLLDHLDMIGWKRCPNCNYRKRIKPMNLKLNRTEATENGVFGELYDDKGKLIAYTAEHSYQQDDGSWGPKTPIGTYTCQKGQHQLHSMTQPFTTYQIMNVPNHNNILLHMGNWPQIDSDGCILLGDAIVDSAKGKMVSNSRAVFAEFIQLEGGIESFELVIS